jgi:hypothetical protein
MSSRMWLLRYVRHLALRSVELMTLQSLPLLSPKVVSIDDGVAKSGLLPTVPEAVMAREVCDFLATLC